MAAINKHRLKILAASIAVLLAAGNVVQAKEFSVRQQARDYQVEATIGRYPLTLGDNQIRIDITDGSGQAVTNADVQVNYYMPPMPRMVPMNYNTKADLKKKSYVAEMDIIMAGPWYIRIIIKHGGVIATTKFNVDAQ